MSRTINYLCSYNQSQAGSLIYFIQHLLPLPHGNYPYALRPRHKKSVFIDCTFYLREMNIEPINNEIGT